MSKFYRDCLIAGRFIYSLMGYQLQVTGLENVLPTGLIVANHASNLDAPSIAFATNREVRFVAKRSNKKLKQRFINAFNPIQTSNGYSVFKEIEQAIRGGSLVGIFPEGTRSYDGKTVEFQRGISEISQRLNIPAIPTAIQGTYGIWPRWKRLPKLGGVIRITFGKPVKPQKSLEEILRQKIIELSQVAQTP